MALSTAGWPAAGRRYSATIADLGAGIAFEVAEQSRQRLRVIEAVQA
jgi:hypothetical protein